uniref:hypothetical protein n=1 Tax=Sphingopyxis terrae TaxID=33052 RepID=UPI0036D320CC
MEGRPALVAVVDDQTGPGDSGHPSSLGRGLAVIDQHDRGVQVHEGQQAPRCARRSCRRRSPPIAGGHRVVGEDRRHAEGKLFDFVEV